MKNIRLLAEENQCKGRLWKCKNGVFEYNSKIDTFSFDELKRLIFFFNSIEKKYGNSKVFRYDIIYEELKFADKLSYILLECLLYHEIIDKKKSITFSIKKHLPQITTEGVLDSCLHYVGDVEKYKKTFSNVISKVHFRKLFDVNKNKEQVSVMMSDIIMFLSNCNIDIKNAEAVAKIVAELSDNAMEHAATDCLIDIDVSRTDYFLPNNFDQAYYAVNIAVVDFSNKLIYSGIQESMKDNDYIHNNEKLYKTKIIHEKYFDENYGEREFYTIAAFQNKVTSRKKTLSTGGRGLTQLISQIQESAYENICYMVTDDVCLTFIKNYIKQDDDKWVGFNFENDHTKKPDPATFLPSPLHIMGTAYNLTFVFKKGENHEENRIKCK